jgi:hypothetical protein
MALEKEQETYARKLPELVGQEGKFALVSGDELLGIFGTYEDALKGGYTQVGVKPFLVREIQAIQFVQFISRFVDSPCRT